MILSEKLIKKFQKVHKKKFGENITRKEAERDLSMLATLLKIILKEKEKQ